MKFLYTNLCAGILCVSSVCFSPLSGGDGGNPEGFNDSRETERLHKNLLALEDRRLRLLPVPKELEFTGETVGADKIAIVVRKENETGKIAADEISSRIEELTGKKAQVLREPANGFYNIIIDNVYPNKFTIDKAAANLPGENQAHGLYPDKNSVVLAGRGDIGTMYAAVTARWLIGEKNGAVVFYPAKITDWPDYITRQTSGSHRFPYMEKHRETPEKHLTDFKKYIDYLFRLKVNRIGSHTWTPFQGAFSPFKTTPEATAQTMKSIKLVNDYAKLRGISNMIWADEALGQSPHQKNNELEKLYLMPWHNIYISWARHDLHKIKAEKIAEYCAATGVSMVETHSPDGGGLRDPETWSDRDALSRAIYPADADRARADADVFNIYAAKLKAKGVEPGFTQYPYGADYFNEGTAMRALGLQDSPAARKSVRDMISREEKWAASINSLIPEEFPFLVRECPGRDAQRFYNLFKNRKFEVYSEVFCDRRDLGELLPRELSALRSNFDRSAAKGIMVFTYSGFNEPVSACAAEYCWNTAFPGWADLDRSRPPYEYDPARLEIMAERAAAGLWGAEAGAELKKVFDRLLSVDFAVQPEKAQKTLNLKNMPAVFAANHKALLRAEAALDQTWSLARKAKEQNKPFMDKFSRPFFIQYYKMIKGAAPHSVTNGAIIYALETLKSGNFKDAEKIVKQALSDLDKTETEFKRVSSELKDEPMVWAYSEITSPYYQSLPRLKVLNPDFAALKGRLNELWMNREKIYQQNNVPAWFGPLLKKRPLCAVKTNSPVKIDGDVSGAEWDAAAPVEHFAGNQILKMPPFPVIMRMLYDEKKLYISGAISQPLAKDIKDIKHGPGEYVPAESAEVFLVPPGGGPGGGFIQVAVDISGNIFTQKKLVSGGVSPEKCLSGFETGAEASVKRRADGWSFELALPFEKLGAMPGPGWNAMLVYNHVENVSPEKIENYATSFADGKGFLRPEIYTPLIFGQQAPAAEPDIEIKCSEMSMKDQLHSSGTGSLVTFKPELETKRPLKDVSVSAEFLLKNKERAGSLKIQDLPFMPLMWRSPATLQFQMENLHKGVTLNIKADYKTLDGKSGSVSRSFILGDAREALSDSEIFQPEGTGEKALAVPVLFDTAANGVSFFSLNKGEISFEFKSGKNFKEGQTHCLLHFGPIRRDAPLNYNRGSLAVLLDRNVISLAVTSDQYKLRAVSGSLPKKKDGEWTKLDFKWNMDLNGKCFMDIYADNRKISGGKISVWGKDDGASAMRVKDEGVTAMQLGNLNSGLLPADCVLKDFTLSNGAGGILRFSFNGTLAGKYESGGKSAVIMARPGTLWR